MDEVITVTEEEIVAATRLVWERMKLVIEPSAGVPVAVALGETFRAKYPDCKKVGVTLSFLSACFCPYNCTRWRWCARRCWTGALSAMDLARLISTTSCFCSVFGGGLLPPECQVGVILCGGNQDLDALPWAKK